MKEKRYLFFLLSLLVLTLILAACSAAEPETIVKEPAESEEVVEEPPSAVGSERTGGEIPEPPESGAKVEVTRVAAEVVVAESVADLEAEASADGEAVDGLRAADTDAEVMEEMPLMATAPAEPAADKPASTELTLDQNSRLTAGEVDDNVDWDDYLLYLREYQGAAVMPVDVSERHQIIIMDNLEYPVLGAQVNIQANGQDVTTLRTHSDGRVYFFPRAYNIQADEYTVNVTANGITESFTIPAAGSQREWFHIHQGASQQGAPTARLDVLFLIDATGSMADEINQLKENIRAISAQIDALPSQPNVRFSLVSYRDRGDAYVAQAHDFTPDVEEFAAILSDVYADGGGDYPEDLNEALSQAVHVPEWRVDETVSLIFLVADAPPHLDYDQENHYGIEMMNAAERGIKIYPIASSGLDSQGEYVFRQLAQFSGGRFIFLTYGAEGAGSTGTETDFEVSDYSVSSLDALVVQIVEEELSHLAR